VSRYRCSTWCCSCSLLFPGDEVRSVVSMTAFRRCKKDVMLIDQAKSSWPQESVNGPLESGPRGPSNAGARSHLTGVGRNPKLDGIAGVHRHGLGDESTCCQEIHLDPQVPWTPGHGEGPALVPSHGSQAPAVAIPAGVESCLIEALVVHHQSESIFARALNVPRTRTRTTQTAATCRQQKEHETHKAHPKRGLWTVAGEMPGLESVNHLRLLRDPWKGAGDSSPWGRRRRPGSLPAMSDTVRQAGGSVHTPESDTPSFNKRRGRTLSP